MAISDRMIRAARGEVALYEEVEHDDSATSEAMTVVSIVALAGGIGSGISGLAGGQVMSVVAGLILGVLSALIGWAVFAGVAYFIGTRLFNAEATWGEVLRTLGYAESPLIVQVIGFVPFLGGLIVLVAGLWTLYLGFVAIRSALDIGGGQTLATIALSIVPAAVIAAIVQAPLQIIR